MGHHRFIPWFLAALVAALLGVAAAAGHLIATSVTGDSASISATDLPLSGRPVIASAFRLKLAPRAGSPKRLATAVPGSEVGRLVLASADAWQARAAGSPAPPGSRSAPAVGVAAEAVVVAAKATRVGAERARRALVEAAELALRDAAEAAAEGEHGSARSAADDAVVLARAAERASTVAADATAAERLARRVVEHPSRYGTRDLPSLPEPFCFSVGRETGHVVADAEPGGLSAAWAMTNGGASLCSSTTRRRPGLAFEDRQLKASRHGSSRDTRPALG